MKAPYGKTFIAAGTCAVLVATSLSHGVRGRCRGAANGPEVSYVNPRVMVGNPCLKLRLCASLFP